jgi:26S proteasome regulatory subunit N5
MISPYSNEKVDLLNTLREVSDGKLYLEKEYANCTR